MNCAFELKALPIADGDIIAPVLHIEWEDPPVPANIHWRHHWMDGDDVVLSLADAHGGYWLRAPTIADFWLQPHAGRLRIRAHEIPLDQDTLEHLLVDQVLPRMLAQRGSLPVHASALCVEGRNALFLGPSGWGKSTLAGLLHTRGYQVLSDDCVLLDMGNAHLRAVPTYPSLRLYPDSLQAVFPPHTQTSAMAHYSPKRRVPIHGTAGSDHDVDALYLIGDPAQAPDGVSIQRLNPAEVCMALIRHSFRLDLGDRTASASQLAQCSSIANQVPAFVLNYPRDFARSAEVIDALTTHLPTVTTRHAAHA